MRALGLLLALAALAPPAGATEVLINSKAPYWEVGPRDPALSRACSVGRFNQRKIGLYTIQLHAKSGGAAVLGVAKGSGLNLVDPDHHASGAEDYIFHNDGTSSCEVFVGGRKPPPQGAAVPAKGKP